MSATACSRRDVGLVAGRERVPPDPERVDAGLFATRGDERVAQLVGPRARERRELGLERRLVDRRRVAARRLHHDVQPRQHRLADEHGEVDVAPAEGALQRVEDRHPHLGRVAVAREVHEARHEAAELVAADEQAEPAPIAEAHDAEREHGETIGRESEHLVARDRLEDVEQGAPPVAHRGERRRAGDHRVRLPAHDGKRAPWARCRPWRCRARRSAARRRRRRSRRSA